MRRRHRRWDSLWLGWAVLGMDRIGWILGRFWIRSMDRRPRSYPIRDIESSPWILMDPLWILT